MKKQQLDRHIKKQQRHLETCFRQLHDLEQEIIGTVGHVFEYAVDPIVVQQAKPKDKIIELVTQFVIEWDRDEGEPDYDEHKCFRLMEQLRVALGLPKRGTL